MDKPLKPVHWIASSRKDLREMPTDVQRTIGFALHQAQTGLTPLSAKPLRGFGGTSVMEIVEDYRTDTYRAVYAAQIGDALRSPLFSEEVEKRQPDPATRDRVNQSSPARGTGMARPEAQLLTTEMGYRRGTEAK